MPRTLLRCDFVNVSLSIVCEFDGEQHSSYNGHFHKNRVGFLGSIKRDVKKEDEMERNGFKIVRINDADLKIGLTREWFEVNYEVFL